ncbi:MAG: hypothetical protein ACYCX9_08980 [Candidatus Dormibacteria bacterium]
MRAREHILRSTTLGACAALAVVLLGAAPVLAAQPAGKGHNPTSSAGGHTSTPTGNDISWPQCGGNFPSGQAFGIVGVNDGLANTLNPCLGPYQGSGASSSELYWAAATSQGTTSQPKASLYVNTADPGNTVSDWPSSGSTPYGTCSPTVSGGNIGQDSKACAWAYGYNKAVQDGQWLTTAAKAVNAAQASFLIPTSPASYPWWLDVETANTWQSSTAMNVADIQGMLAGLDSFGTPTIGIYSTSYQWSQIVGAKSTFSNSGLPDWIPGARKLSGAETNCSLSSFTGGKVTVTQWFGHPFDGDYACPS